MAVWRFPVTLTSNRWGRCNNTWHIRTGNLITTETAALNSAAAALRTWYNSMSTFMAASMTVTADVAIEETDKRDLPVTFTTVNYGTNAGDAPPMLSMVTSWSTASRTRRGRGRTFLGPLGSGAMQNDGTIEPAPLAALNAANTALVNASLTDNDWAIGIWGLESPAPDNYTGDYSELPHVIRDIVGARVQDKFGVMRSRRP